MPFQGNQTIVHNVIPYHEEKYNIVEVILEEVRDVYEFKLYYEAFLYFHC